MTYAFGSWSGAVLAAGLHPGRRPWQREQIIAALRVHAAEHGRAPAASQWKRSTEGHPTASTVREVFGTWAAALASAGLPPNPVGRPPKTPSG